MTHLALDSSEEDHWGSLLGGEGDAFPGASTTCLRGSVIPPGSLGP